MSAIRKSFDELLAAAIELNVVDQAYIKMLARRADEGFSQSEAMRIAIIYAQWQLDKSKKPMKGIRPAHIKVGKECFQVFIDFHDTETRESIKALTTRKYNPVEKCWDVPFESQAAMQLKSLVGRQVLIADLSFDLKLNNLLASERKNNEDSTRIKSSFQLKPGFGSKDYFPYAFQLAGVEFGVAVENPLFGDDMGLGKSIQILAWAHHLNLFPLLIVTKAGLKLNIKEEIEKAFPGKRLVICDSKTVITKFDIAVINYDLLSAGWADTKKKNIKFTGIAQQIMNHGYKAMALDEAHYIKTGANRRSQRSVACIAMGERAERRAAATGTPINNSNLEIINILLFLGHLKKFGGEWEFKRRYCGAKQIRVGPKMVWDFSESTNNDELRERLKSICMVRRLKDEVEMDLPPKVRFNFNVELSNRAEYNRVKKNVIQVYTEWKTADIKFQDSIKHLYGIEREMAIEKHRKSAEMRAKFQKTLIEYGILRQLCSQGKIDAFVEKVEELLDNGHKVLCFAFYKATQLALYERLKHRGFVTIMGDDSTAERDRAKKAFQAGEAPGVVISIMSGSDGLNLQEADYVMCIETCFTPTIMRQCEDRAHRIGQKSTVMAGYCWAENSIDDKVRRILTDKTRIFSESIDGVRGNITEDHAIEVLEDLLR